MNLVLYLILKLLSRPVVCANFQCQEANTCFPVSSQSRPHYWVNNVRTAVAKLYWANVHTAVLARRKCTHSWAVVHTVLISGQDRLNQASWIDWGSKSAGVRFCPRSGDWVHFESRFDSRRPQFRAILCLCNNKDMYNWPNFSNSDDSDNVPRRIRSLKPQASNLRSRRPHEY